MTIFWRYYQGAKDGASLISTSTPLFSSVIAEEQTLVFTTAISTGVIVFLGAIRLLFSTLQFPKLGEVAPLRSLLVLLDFQSISLCFVFVFLVLFICLLSVLSLLFLCAKIHNK
jgi:hypothetical protein